jgi:hypothetical protein
MGNFALSCRNLETSICRKLNANIVSGFVIIIMIKKPVSGVKKNITVGALRPIVDGGSGLPYPLPAEFYCINEL